MNCFLVLVFSFLNVNFLFAKKLKDKADDVEIILLNNVGKPIVTNANKITKSIIVLTAPTSEKRNLSSCFFINVFMIILLDKI